MAYVLARVRAADRRLLLYGACVALAGGEALALWLVGFTSALPVAPQMAAPPPFGAYHDLRWVFTFSWSWLSVAWELAALVATRTALTAGLTLLAWPDDVPRPRPRIVLVRSLFGTLVTIVVLSPWATLAYAGAAVSFSWFVLGSIVAVALTAVMTPSVVVAGAWWRRVVPWRAMLFGLAVWLALMVEALVIFFAPGWVTVVVAAVSGALNALLWRHQVTAVVHAPVRHRRFPLAPPALLGVLALILVGGGYAIPGNHLGSEHNTTTVHLTSGGPLLYVPGYGSAYDGGPFTLLGTPAWHFSYAGMRNGEPAPYAATRTQQSLTLSAHLLAAQAAALHEESGSKIVLIADSEGSLVVRLYLQDHPHPPVRMFIETSPLLRPASVYFPAAGHDGFGIAAGWEARALLRMVHLENPDFTGTADEPFIRSVIDEAGRLRGVTMCPAGAMPVFAMVPLEGALTVHDQPVSHVTWTALPGYHAHLLQDVDVQRDLATLIETGRLPHHAKSTTAFLVISGAASAWQAPALPLALRPAWRSGDHLDAEFAGWQCPS